MKVISILSVHERVDDYSVGQHLHSHMECTNSFGLSYLPRQQSWAITKQLTWKTSVLLALTRPSYSVDLSQLDIIQKHYKPDEVMFLVFLSVQCQLHRYVSIHLFNSLSCPSILQSIYFLIDAYINIARHMSFLIIYHMEEISIKQTSLVINNWSCKLFFLLSLLFWGSCNIYQLLTVGLLVVQYMKVYILCINYFYIY